MRSLFDPRDPAPVPAPQRDRQVLTVSELNAIARSALETTLPAVWVEGEVSNCKRAPSGHWYLTLKDSGAQIGAVLFRAQAAALRFRLEDGLKIQAFGRVSLYEARGAYQIVLDRIEPAGLGALQLAFEQLKTRLAAEGLFDAARKRPLPILPRRIGLVASPGGAALRDILRVLERRFAGLRVVIAPSRVQGDGAAAEIVEAIRRLNALGGIDLLILARGGGSIEDLWAFNEEIVARAIAASAVPVVSAVGHEVDVTIADLVADLRAPTPSAAAEMIVRSRAEFLESIDALRRRLDGAVLLAVTRGRHRLEAAGAARALEVVRGRWREAALRLDDRAARLRGAAGRRAAETRHTIQVLAERMTPRRLAERLSARRQRLAGLRRMVETAIAARLQAARSMAARAGGRLDALSPLAVLGRGYAICRAVPSGAILKEAAAVAAGEAVRVRLHRGALLCAVTEVEDGGRAQDR
jgi:exodeoxyribonuclease VII large subunit